MTDPSSTRSWATCPNPDCAERPDPGANFCENCGADLVVRAGTSEVAGSDAPRTCPSCSAVTVDDNVYCEGCGLRHPARTDRVEIDLGDLGGVSDRGLKRSYNQDAMALGRRLSVARAAVVCDGVSTTVTPELAATAAADTALDVLLHSRVEPTTRTRDAVVSAGRKVAALGRAPHGPSCTFVSALVEPTGGGTAEPGVEITVGWVGDSRAYWLAAPDAAEPARLLTRDHSWATEMVAVGMDPAQAAADRRAHQITRWLGPEGTPRPEVLTLRPTGPGLLLLCSDGLWNHEERAAELTAAALSGGTPPTTGPLPAATALTTLALAAGGRDNVTVVIIPVTP